MEEKLESKKHVFIDNDEERKELILGVLDKYCVPRTVIPDRQEDMFGNSYTWYDIEINVNDKAWEFINGKVKEVLALEDSYDMRCQPGTGRGKKEIEKTEHREPRRRQPQQIGLGGLLGALFTGLGTGMIASPEDVEAFLASPNVKTYTKFDELPQEIKEDLLEQYPEEILKSPNCNLRVTQDDNGNTSISIKYVK